MFYTAHIISAAVFLINQSIALNYDILFNEKTLNESFVNGRLEELAQVIGEKYFLGVRCINVIREKGLLQNFWVDNSMFVFEVDSSKDDCTDILYNFFRKSFEDKCPGYLVQLRNPRCAIQGWFDTYKKSFVPRHNPKYFFLPVYPDSLTYADDLLSMQQTDLTANILVAEISENETDWVVKLSTNNFYEHPTNPGRNPKIFLDEWSYKTGFKDNIDLYPDKLIDLKGKPFRISTGLYLPFTSADPIDGMENLIAVQFCEMRNCTPVAVTDEFYWGTIYENFTGNGICGNVYDDSSDIGTMAVYLWLGFSYFMDYTASYLYGDVTVMTPKPTKIGGWIIPFLPFKVDMWVAFFLSLVLSSLSLFVITRASIKYTRFADSLIKKVQFTTLDDSSLRAIGLAVLQQPSSRLIGDSPNRYLFTSFEFLYLVLSAMYSAELASFLTVPLYNPPIDKFHDFALSGIYWFGEHEAWSYGLKESPDPDPITVVQHFRVISMKELKEKAQEGKYGFTAERLPGGTITEQEHITEDVIPLYHIMKEAMFGSPLVAAIKKGGPYNDHYDTVVNKVVEHGFSLFWEADVTRKYMKKRIQDEYNEAKTIHMDSEPTIIKLPHIVGMLYLYFIGITLSILAFLYEIIRCPKVKEEKEDMITENKNNEKEELNNDEENKLEQRQYNNYLFDFKV